MEASFTCDAQVTEGPWEIGSWFEAEAWIAGPPRVYLDAYIGPTAVASDEWADAPDIGPYVVNAWDTRYSWNGVDAPFEVRQLIDWDLLTANASDPDLRNDPPAFSGFQTGWVKMTLTTGQYIYLPSVNEYNVFTAVYVDTGVLTRLFSSVLTWPDYYTQPLFFPPYGIGGGLGDGVFSRPEPPGYDGFSSAYFFPPGTYYFEIGNTRDEPWAVLSGGGSLLFQILNWNGFTAKAIITEAMGWFRADAVVSGDYVLVDHWDATPDYFDPTVGVLHIATGDLVPFDVVNTEPWIHTDILPDGYQVGDSDGQPYFWGVRGGWVQGYHISYIRLRIPAEGAWISLKVDGAVTQDYAFSIRTARSDDGTLRIGPGIWSWLHRKQETLYQYDDSLFDLVYQRHIIDYLDQETNEYVDYVMPTPFGWERLQLESQVTPGSLAPHLYSGQSVYVPGPSDGPNVYPDGSVDYWVELGYQQEYTSGSWIASIQWEVFTPPSFTADARITEHVIVANAVVLREMGGSNVFDADIVKDFRVWGEFFCYAIQRKERGGSFSADASLGRIFKVDAITRREVRTPFYADAVLNRGRQITADAWLVGSVRVFERALSADAVVKVPNKFTADAVVLAGVDNTFRAKAYVWGQMGSGFMAWAWIIGTTETFTADAQTAVPSTGGGSFSAESEVSATYRLRLLLVDAVIQTLGRNDLYAEAFIGNKFQFTADAVVDIRGSFLADAWIFPYPYYPLFFYAHAWITLWFSADAWIVPVFTADAIIGQTYETYDADACIKRTQVDGFEPIAIIYRTDMLGSFTAGAWLSGVFTADALVVTRSGGRHAFRASAYIRRWLPGPNPPPPGVDDNRYQAKDVQITVGGSDITDDVLWNECSFTQTARVMPGTFSVGILGSHRGHEGQKLELLIDGQTVFAGYVTTTESSFVFPSVLVGDDTPVTKTTLSGPDVNVILDRYLIYDPLKNPEEDTKGINTPWYGTPGFNPGKTDAFLVAWYTGKWSKAKETGLDYTGNVDVCGVVNPTVVGRIADWNGVSLRAAYQQFSRVTSAIFWIDPYMSLHWHSRFEVSAPFAIGDGEEFVNGRDMSGRTTIERQVSDTIVWGTLMSEKDPQKVDRVSYIREKSDEGGSGFQLGEWHADVHKTTSLKVRAQTIIARYKKPLDMVTISIFEPGIQAGMVVELRLGSHGGQYVLPVKSLTITFEGMHTQRTGYPRFTLDCGIDPEDPWQVFDPLPWPEIDIPHTQSPQVGFWNGGGDREARRRFGPYTHYITDETGPLRIHDTRIVRDGWEEWSGPTHFEAIYQSYQGPGFFEFNGVYRGELSGVGPLVGWGYGYNASQHPGVIDGTAIETGGPLRWVHDYAYVPNSTGPGHWMDRVPAPGIFSARPTAPPNQFYSGSVVEINYEAEYVFEVVSGFENRSLTLSGWGMAFSWMWDPVHIIIKGPYPSSPSTDFGPRGWTYYEYGERWDDCSTIFGVNAPWLHWWTAWFGGTWSDPPPDGVSVGDDLLWTSANVEHGWPEKDEDPVDDMKSMGSSYFRPGVRYRVKFQSLYDLPDTYQDKFGNATETKQHIWVNRSKIWIDGNLEPPCWMTVSSPDHTVANIPPMMFVFGIGNASNEVRASDGEYIATLTPTMGVVLVHEFKVRSVYPDKDIDEPSSGADIGWGTEMPAYLGDRVFETTRPYWGHSMKIYWHGERLIYGRDWKFIIYATMSEGGVETDLPQDETGEYPDTSGLSPEQLATVKIKPLTKFRLLGTRSMAATLTPCGELDPAVRCSYLSRTGDFESMPGHPRDTRTSTNPDHITFFDIPGRR
jgi:hypothetical protein